MKSIKIFSLLLFCMSFIFTACTDEAKYSGADMPDGVQVYFSNTLSSIIELSSSSTSFEVELRRVDTNESLTVALTSVADIDLFMIPNSVIFPAGEESVKISITYSPDMFEYDVYKAITLSISDKNLTSIYGKSEYKFEAGVPAPWESLGVATFSENFWYAATVEVELQQHMLDPTRYRLVDPFTTIIDLLKEEGVDLSANNNGNQSKYLEFKVNPSGSTIVGVTTTVEGLVSYGDINIGYNHASYGEDIYMMHPSRFTSLASESLWLHNIVVQFSSDGQPEVVQLAPYYYMFNVGGWNQTQNDNVAVIVFPGVVVADYSAEVTYLGRFTDTNKVDNAVGSVTFGADVTSVKVAMIEGSDISAAVDAIIGGSLQATEMSASGQFSFPCETSGTYSFVVVTYADGEAKLSGSATFKFTSSQGGEEDPDWTSLGMATYTDDILAPMYGEGNSTYLVEIQENKATSGLFRLVNPYGEAFPYNDPGDWDDNQDYYVEINASDPTGVYIPLQNTGLNWGDGNFYIYSKASNYLDNGYSLAEIKAAGYCGTYNGSEISFPVDALLCAFAGDSNLYLANRNGAFKIVMPSTSYSITSLNSISSPAKMTVARKLNGSPAKMKMFRKITSFDLLVK